MKILSKLILRFQRYCYFCAAQNNIIHRKLNAIMCYILKPILANSDSFCLITSHFCCCNLVTLHRSNYSMAMYNPLRCTAFLILLNLSDWLIYITFVCWLNQSESIAYIFRFTPHEFHNHSNNIVQ